MAASGWRERMSKLAVSPLAYVVAFGVGGAALIVAGIALIGGTAWALVSAGAFLLAGAAFITRGMSNG